MEHDELYHYGVKGMKWGIRRTPQQLGHTVAKVKNKIADASKKRKEQKAKKKEEADKKESSTKKKSIKDMSTAELQQYYNRINLERNVLETQRRLSELQPQKTSRGKDFIKSVANDVILGNIKNASRDYLNRELRKALNLDNMDPLKSLRDEVDKLNLESKKLRYEDDIAKRRSDREKSNKSSSESTQTSSQKSNNSDDVIEVTNFTVEDVPRSSVSNGYNYVNSVLLPAGRERR